MAGFFAKLPGVRSRLARSPGPAAPPQLPYRTSSAFLGDYTALTLLHGAYMIYVDTRSTDIAPHLMMRGEWEPHEVATFQRMIRPGDTVFDLGANVGVYSLIAAAATGPRGQVHAFEPNPRNAALLARSLAVNGFDGFSTIHAVAVGEEEGTATLVFNPEWSGGGFMDTSRAEGGVGADGDRRVPTRVVTLDRYFTDPSLTLDVAKLDIEGMEGRALRGMRGLLERSPRARLMIEWAPDMLARQGVTAAEIVALLAGIGFRFWTISGRASLEPIAAEALGGMTDGLQNVVAARGPDPA